MTDPITTPAQMREAAARCCEAEADKCDDAAKWGGSKRYVSDCKAAAYAMRDRAAAIRALPVAEPAPVSKILTGLAEAKAFQDAILTGTGVMRDGEYVAPQDFFARRSQRE